MTDREEGGDDEGDHGRSDGGRGGQMQTGAAMRTRQRENGVSVGICCLLFAPPKSLTSYDILGCKGVEQMRVPGCERERMLCGCEQKRQRG